MQSFSDIREQMNKVLQEQIDQGFAEKGGPYGLPAILANKHPKDSRGQKGMSNIMPTRFSVANSPSLVPNTQLYKAELDAFKLELEEETVMNLIERDFQVLSLGPLKSELLVNQLQISLHQSLNSLNEVDAKCFNYETRIKALEKRHKREIDQLKSQMQVLPGGSEEKNAAEEVNIDLTQWSPPSVGHQGEGVSNSPATRVKDLVWKESSRYAASKLMGSCEQFSSAKDDSLEGLDSSPMVSLDDSRWNGESQSEKLLRRKPRL